MASSKKTTETNISKAEAVWLEFGAAINRTLLSYEADPALRQDLAQNVFLAVLKSVERIDQADNRKGYLFRIVHNVAMDHIAQQIKHYWFELEEQVSHPGPSPEQAVTEADESRILLQAIRKLQLPYRQVMLLLLEDFSQAEIAEVLGISNGAVRVRVNRAKQQLKQRLNHD